MNKKLYSPFQGIPAICRPFFDDIFPSSKIVEELDKFFGNTMTKKCFSFPIDIYNQFKGETKLKTVIEIAVAGVPKDKCSVILEEDKILVSINQPKEKQAQKQTETKTTDKTSTETEIRREYIQHSISQAHGSITWVLSPTVNKSKIKVEYNEGILRIELPFKEKEKPEVKHLF